MDTETDRETEAERERRRETERCMEGAGNRVSLPSNATLSAINPPARLYLLEVP